MDGGISTSDRGILSPSPPALPPTVTPPPPPPAPLSLPHGPVGTEQIDDVTAEAVRHRQPHHPIDVRRVHNEEHELMMMVMMMIGTEATTMMGLAVWSMTSETSLGPLTPSSEVRRSQRRQRSQKRRLHRPMAAHMPHLRRRRRENLQQKDLAT